MPPRVVDVEQFFVIGISARTNNAQEMTPQALIPVQWQKFVQNNLSAHIPGRVDSDTLVVYTNYATDRDGDYDYVIGARVRPDAIVPDGMVMERVPAGKYWSLRSDKGPVADVTVGVWKQIWSFEDSFSTHSRAYKADYEIYDQRSADPRNAQIDVYVGIK